MSLLTRDPSTTADAVIAFQRRLDAAGLAIPLRLWDGRTVGPDGTDHRLVLRFPWSLRAMLFPPTDLQVGEAYLEDVVDVEGSMVSALRSLVRLREGLTARGRRSFLGLLARLPAPPRGADTGGRVALRGRLHSRERDAAAIRHHYDVGDELYRLFLDRGLVYSCAYFADEDRATSVGDRAVLDRAQQRKLELVCRKLALRAGDRFLDVGCGWGSLVIHAAREHGVQALGVTISENQAALARERVEAAGLADRVRIELRDYREVQERFDAIASVGMVEHVGAEELDGYVAHLHELLDDGGRLLNHGITTGRRDVVRDMADDPDSFIGRYVFPDGALVPAYRMIQHVERNGFELRDVEQLRPHYARTLQHWTANLEGAYDDAVDAVGERTFRIWRAYLAGSALGFERGDLGVVQVLATRGDGDLPLDRDHLHLGALSRESG